MAAAAMTPPPGRREIAAVVVALTLGAAAAPLPLYLAALACFGLPHVLWELGYVRAVWRGALPRYWWTALGAVLALQALARLGSWAGLLDSRRVAACDAVTLALVLLLVLPPALRGGGAAGLGAAVLALGAAGLLVFAGQRGDLLAPLALLAIAHNFTPLALVRGEAHLGALPLRPLLGALFALPPLLAALLWSVGYAGGFGAASLTALQSGEHTWLTRHAGGAAAALVAGVVLAQCLHYYTVLRLLPASLDSAWHSSRWQRPALIACLAMSLGFALDYTGARGLYAVAAGLHAWLEWPLVLLAVLPRRAAQLVAPASG
jgi:hypothetical protein